jgi:hypothetical protein
MDFIKKHYEKILLAAALIVLIGSAGFLAFRASALSQEVSTAQFRPKPKVKTVQPGDMGSYSNAIASLLSPALWQTRDVDPFGSKRIVIDSGPPKAIPVQGDPIAVAQIIRQPFKLIFRSYTGQGENFQVDFLTGRRSFFVRKVGDKVADQFGDTTYVTTRFEPKTKTVFNRGLSTNLEVDVSQLTIQHPGDDSIVMPLNKVVEEKEPVAMAQCAGGVQQFQIRRGQDFDCGTNTYNVVDITSTQVIIVDKLTKEKRTIKPAVGK